MADRELARSILEEGLLKQKRRPTVVRSGLLAFGRYTDYTLWTVEQLLDSGLGRPEILDQMTHVVEWNCGRFTGNSVDAVIKLATAYRDGPRKPPPPNSITQDKPYIR